MFAASSIECESPKSHTCAVHEARAVRPLRLAVRGASPLAHLCGARLVEEHVRRLEVEVQHGRLAVVQVVDALRHLEEEAEAGKGWGREVAEGWREGGEAASFSTTTK